MLPIRRTLAAVLCAAAVSAAGGAWAQDATPESGIEALEALNAVEIPGLPNALHAGTCDDYAAEAVAALAPAEFQGAVVEGVAVVDGEDMTPEAMGGGLGIPVAVGSTSLDLAIEDIVAGGHALVVADPADGTRAIACGVVDGRVDERGNLFVGIEQRNESGVSGIAWLHEVDGKTTVTVMLTRPFFVERETPGFEATPSA
ncbi:MAG: hypothetical protein ACKOWF_13070 [Chloroflexota bacterium]